MLRLLNAFGVHGCCTLVPSSQACPPTCPSAPRPRPCCRPSSPAQRCGPQPSFALGARGTHAAPAPTQPRRMRAPPSLSARRLAGRADEPLPCPRHAQWIRLPRQMRVTQDEYREFLNLGHGEIFTLNMDRCVGICTICLDTASTGPRRDLHPQHGQSRGCGRRVGNALGFPRAFPSSPSWTTFSTRALDVTGRRNVRPVTHTRLLRGAAQAGGGALASANGAPRRLFQLRPHGKDVARVLPQGGAVQVSAPHGAGPWTPAAALARTHTAPAAATARMYVRACVVCAWDFASVWTPRRGRSPASGRVRCLAAQRQASQKHTHRCRGVFPTVACACACAQGRVHVQESDRGAARGRRRAGRGSS